MTGVAVTNRQLTFARYQLGAWRSALEGDNQVAAHACKEALLFHLISAYRALLRELLLSAGRDAQPESATDACYFLHQLQKKVPELEQLKLLESQQESWPSQLQRAFNQVWQPQLSESSGQIIQSYLPRDPDEYQALYQAFYSFVGTARQMLTEW